MRKQHNFRVGDKLESLSGITCTVARIDPACNNVYVKDFSNYRADGDELSSPRIWKVIESPATAAITAPSEIAPTVNSFEVTILKLSASDPLTTTGFSSKFVQRETVDKSGEGLSYRNQVKEYLEGVAPDLSVPGEYIAVAIYGDGDTITRQFTVKPLPVKAPVEVTFA